MGPRRRLRLKTTLLGLLVPSVLALLIFDSWSDYETLHRTTDKAYDRALLGPALALSNSVRQRPDGSFVLDAPQLALAMLESAPGQRIYFRVTMLRHPPQPQVLPDGEIVYMQGEIQTPVEVAGMRDLPGPGAWPIGIEPVFYSAVYRSDPVRVVALSRPLDYPGDSGRHLTVQVAESTSGRSQLQADAWNSKLSRNLIIILVMVILLLFGVYWALWPLARLRAEVRMRAADDLNPLDASKVPHEIVPLVQAVNHHVQRLRDVLDAQSQFLVDASHQLRTPLAIMRTQVEYALREPGTPRTRSSLQAILAQLERSGRLTAQLLSLAHASHARLETAAQLIDVRKLAYEITLDHLPLAHARRQDLGWDDASTNEALWVMGLETALFEAMSNIIHNAIRYTPDHGRITVSVHAAGHEAVINVRDTGPGVEPALRARVFERFRRGDGQAGEGAGLGLAIAREFMVLNGGRIELWDGDASEQGGKGLSVCLYLPLVREG